MTALIRGMDYIVEVASELEKYGFDEIIHWSNSTTGMGAGSTNEHSEVILFCPNYLNDNIRRNIQEIMTRLGLSAVWWSC